MRLAEPDHNKNYTSENIITVGDHVEIELSSEKERQEVEAYILSMEKRKNKFCRASYGKMQILASNIDMVCIFSSLNQPMFRHGFIDRVLLETTCSLIPTHIILNKYDLLEKDNIEHKQILEKIKHYQDIGIQVFQESFKNTVSEYLKKIIENNRTLLVGQSGVGKSTFVNQMLGKKRQSTAAIGSTNKGRHTTTNFKLYDLGNMELIDSPGVREFGLQHLTEAQVVKNFPEFYQIKCKFDNCTHINEPKCGILEMILRQDKNLPPWRYHSYIRILASIHEQYRYRRGNHRN